MGDFLRADLDVLRGAADSMTRAGQMLNDVREKMSHDAGLRIGTDELVSAADDFQETWRYGAEQISKGVEAASDGLRRSHDAYASVEQESADALHQIGQSGAASPGANNV